MTMPDAPRTDPYTLTPTQATGDRLAAYSRLLSDVFPTSRRYTLQYMRWQYAENPDGEVVGFDAYSGDELAAHYVTIPIRARIAGESVAGVLSLNTATHAKHQGKGLFTRLAQATYVAAAENGYRFVIGVANANSTPGFLRKLGFTLVGQLDVRIGLGRPAALSIAAFEREWSASAAAWRVADPSADYRRAGAGLYADPLIPLCRMLVTSKLSVGGQNDPLFFARHPLTGWIGLMPDLRWKGIAFPVPSKMRPSPLNLIFKSLSPEFTAPNAKDVHFEALDFDAY